MGILAGDYLINNWRPDLVERVMAYLSPDNVRVTVLTKNAKFFARYVKGGLISEETYFQSCHIFKIMNEINLEILTSAWTSVWLSSFMNS